MSRYYGQMDGSGKKNGRKNKGVARMMREVARTEAEERNSRTPIERTARYRREYERQLASYKPGATDGDFSAEGYAVTQTRKTFGLV